MPSRSCSLQGKLIFYNTHEAKTEYHSEIAMDEKTAKKIMMDVTKTYNEISKEFSNTRSFAGKEFKVFREYLRPGQTIMDLGCGNGRLLQFLEKEASSWHLKTFYYHGVDASKNLLAEARKKYPHRTFQNGEMTKIPDKENSIDLLFCIRAFHHQPNRKTRLKALKEMKRVLKSNGTIILTVWNLWQKKYRWQLTKAILRSIVTLGRYAPNDTFIPWGKEKKPRYYHAFTIQELKKLAQESGLDILELSKADPGTQSHDFILICKK